MVGGLRRSFWKRAWLTPSIYHRSTEKEIQDFWNMKPSVREAAAQRLCTVADAEALDDQMSLVWNQCEKEGVKDYDINGVVNCCDRATAFCIKWRKSYRNDIRLCQQQTNVLNHMYVQIYLSQFQKSAATSCLGIVFRP